MHNLSSRGLDRRAFLQSSSILAALGISVPFLAGCGSSSSSASPVASQTGAKAATGASSSPYTGQFAVPLYKQLPDSIPFIIGLANGYFSKRGLTLKPVSFTQGTDVIRSVISSTHLGSSSTISGMVARGTGFPTLRIVGSCLSAPSIRYCVKPDSPIKSPEDLKGKKIGVNAPTSITTYLGQEMVKKAGLSGSDVSMVNVKGVSDSATALENGVVDCSWTSPPLSEQLVGEGKIRIIWDAAKEFPDFTQTVLFSDTKFISEHRDVVENWLAGVAEAGDFVRAEPDKAAAIWAKEIGIDEAIALSTIKGLAPYFTVKMTDTGFKQNMDASLQLGVLKEAIPQADVYDSSLTAGLK